MRCFLLSVFVLLVIVEAASSFKCYKCGPEKQGEGYTRQQCETNLKDEECNATTSTCFQVIGKLTGDREVEVRGCESKEFCETTLQQMCTDSSMMETFNITECKRDCCATHGDTPCNNLLDSAFIGTASMLLMMLTVLCSVMLF